MNDPAYITHLYQTRDQYRSNAETAIVAGEFRKASESLWGSITQELKALAATYGVVISSHRQFFEFLKQLEKGIGGQVSVYRVRRIKRFA